MRNINRMAIYDSDSSDGEDADYTETGVLLGYASKEPTEDNISQLGGYPVRQVAVRSQRRLIIDNQPDMAGLLKTSACHSCEMQSLQ